jgi:hypothetical protein
LHARELDRDAGLFLESCYQLEHEIILRIQILDEGKFNVCHGHLIKHLLQGVPESGMEKQ